MKSEDKYWFIHLAELALVMLPYAAYQMDGFEMGVITGIMCITALLATR